MKKWQQQVPVQRGPAAVGSLLVALALGIAACGGDGRDAPSTSSSPVEGAGSVPPGFESPTPEQTVSDQERGSADIVMFTGEAPQGFDNGGYGFEEDSVSSPGPTITVAAGEELTLVLENVSEEYLQHDFTVVSRKNESAEPLWGGQTATIDPGESTLLTFTPEAPGKYFYICSLLGHTSGHGMWGRFLVEQS